jgi:hypothetical protein
MSLIAELWVISCLIIICFILGSIADSLKKIAKTKEMP